MTEITVPCTICSGTGWASHEDRHTETRQDQCRTCGGTGQVPARPGEARETSWPFAVPGAQQDAETSSASDPVQILYAGKGSPPTVRTILLPVPRAELSHGPEGWRFVALDAEAREQRWIEMSGIRAWGEKNVAAALPEDAEHGLHFATVEILEWMMREGLMRHRTPEDDGLVIEGIIRTALLAVIRSSGGGDLTNTSGRDPGGSGSRASIEPADAVSPAFGGVDPSRMALLPVDNERLPLNDSALPSVMIWEGGEAYDDLRRRNALFYTDPDALDLDSCAIAVGIYRAMTAAAAEAPPPAPGIETEGQNPKGSGAKHEGPIAAGEAPTSIDQVPSPTPTPTRQEEGSRGGGLDRDGNPPAYAPGDRVQKITGDYRISGIVRGVILTGAGLWRYAVEHTAEGGGAFLHIYAGSNLRVAPTPDATSGGEAPGRDDLARLRPIAEAAIAFAKADALRCSTIHAKNAELRRQQDRGIFPPRVEAEHKAQEEAREAYFAAMKNVIKVAAPHPQEKGEADA